MSSLNSFSTFFSLYLSLYICLTFFKLLEVRCKIESVVGVYFKKLLAKIVNLIFKYILSSYFVKCDRRYSKSVTMSGRNRNGCIRVTSIKSYGSQYPSNWGVSISSYGYSV